MEIGTVTRIEGLTVLVRLGGGDERASVRGSLKAGPRRSTHPVAVGDRVVVERDARRGLAVRCLEQRRNLLARTDPGDSSRCHVIAANIDQVACVQSYRDPPLNLRGLDRFLLLASAAGVPACIILNKADLLQGPEPPEIAYYQSLGYRVVRVSARTGAGIPDLRESFARRTTPVTGPSGCGKSSLLNAVIPGLHLPTRPVSHATSKGVHTTVRVEWLDLADGGVVLDTPGLRAILPWGLDAGRLAHAFPEFVEPAGECRFPDCMHRGESGCAIRSAVEHGRVPAFRYDSYLRILATLQGRGLRGGGAGAARQDSN